MTDTVIPYPGGRTLRRRAPSRTAPAGGGAVASLLRILDRVDCSMEDLRLTERLVKSAGEAMDSGDLERMVALRDLLARRIAVRRALRGRDARADARHCNRRDR